MTAANPRTVYYASVGSLLKLFDVDADGAELRERGAITAPANIQYAWPHPSRRFLYVVSSNGGPGIPGDKHFANAFLIDPTTGGLSPHGEPAALPSRPIHTSVDRSGGYLLTAYNNPSGLTVHRLAADGSIGAPVQAAAGSRHRHLCASDPGDAVESLRRAGDARQPRDSEQAGGSRRDQDIRI